MPDQVKKDVMSSSFEVSLDRLQEIVTQLEKGDISLDMGLQLYKEGMLCARSCKEQLQKARHEISVWQNGEEIPFEQQIANICGVVAES